MRVRGAQVAEVTLVTQRTGTMDLRRLAPVAEDGASTKDFDQDEDTDDDSVSFAAAGGWPEDETTLRRVARLVPTGMHRLASGTQPPPPPRILPASTQVSAPPRLAHPRLLRRDSLRRAHS